MKTLQNLKTICSLFCYLFIYQIHLKQSSPESSVSILLIQFSMVSTDALSVIQGRGYISNSSEKGRCTLKKVFVADKILIWVSV